MVKLNLGSGGHPLEGFINLDMQDGWIFENGLEFENESVDAITISHALMYLQEQYFPNVFKEWHRVLKKGGIVRITEDDSRFWKWHDRVTELTPAIIQKYFWLAGFEANKIYNLTKNKTYYKDDTLMQDWHPKSTSFFIEAIK